MKEYSVIRAFYGTITAKRSGIPLINHIDEGLDILDLLGASELVKKAFCIHPIVQNDEQVDVCWSEAHPLALEYTLYANKYLCRPENDWIDDVEKLYKFLGGGISFDCKLMLLADKLQNRKDFMLSHYGTHPRSEQLKKYFDLWIHFLIGP